MIYRQLGRTGLRVSQLGFGAMHLPMTGGGKDARVDDALAVPLMRYAFERGVNYIDSAVFYCNADSQRAVGEALKGWHGRIVVSTKNSYKGTDERSWWKNLEDSLRFLGVTPIDVYNIHGLSWKVWREVGESHLRKWLAQAMDQGLIRHICCSSHDTLENVRKLMDTGFLESFTVQYNLLDRALEDAIAYAAGKGIGVAVMGPHGGGRLTAPNDVFGAMLPGVRKTNELALRFVLANPSVSVALSGMTSREQIDENVAIASDPVALRAEDHDAIDQRLRELKDLADHYCTGCGYCMPCPQNVRIPRIFRNYALAKVYKLWDRARKDYAAMVNDVWDAGAKQADACADCGQCEAKCPQKLPIREQLKAAHEALKTPPEGKSADTP